MRVSRTFVISIVIFCSNYLWAENRDSCYFAGIPPIAGILNHLILPQEQVEVICASNTNPHTFDISPAQLQKLTNANIFFHTHFPYELKIVETLKETKSSVLCVDVTEGIKWRGCHTHTHDEHSHSHKHHHSHKEEDKDLHCWLSPENMKIISQNILSALIKHNLSQEELYRSRYNAWLKKLEETHQEVKNILSPYKGKKFYVFHPAFSYFAEYYGLKEVCIEMEGRSPSPKQMRLLMEQMQKDSTKVIFIQPQFDPKPAEVIAKAVNAEVVVINDFEQDILQNLLSIAKKIASSYQGK